MGWPAWLHGGGDPLSLQTSHFPEIYRMTEGKRWGGLDILTLCRWSNIAGKYSQVSFQILTCHSISHSLLLGYDVSFGFHHDQDTRRTLQLDAGSGGVWGYPSQAGHCKTLYTTAIQLSSLLISDFKIDTKCQLEWKLVPTFTIFPTFPPVR